MSESSGQAQQPRETLAQWVAFLGPPVIWLAQFEVKYALAGNVAGSRGHTALMITGVVGLALMGVCALVAYREWRLAEASPLDRFARTGDRIRFMAILGLASSALFALVTIAQIIADFFIAPGKS